MKQNIMGSWRCCLLRVFFFVLFLFLFFFLQPFDQAFVPVKRQQKLEG